MASHEIIGDERGASGFRLWSSGGVGSGPDADDGRSLQPQSQQPTRP